MQISLSHIWVSIASHFFFWASSVNIFQSAFKKCLQPCHLDCVGCVNTWVQWQVQCKLVFKYYGCTTVSTRKWIVKFIYVGIDSPFFSLMQNKNTGLREGQLRGTLLPAVTSKLCLYFLFLQLHTRQVSDQSGSMFHGDGHLEHSGVLSSGTQVVVKSGCCKKAV